MSASGETTSATDGRKMWLSFVKEYENVHQVTHAQAMASCSALWADPKVKEGYYAKKCKTLKVDPPKKIPKSRGKGPNPNPGKAGRPKGTTNRKAKLMAEAAKPKDVVIHERKAENIPVEPPAKITRKKRLNALEKKIFEMEEQMKRMKPIDDSKDEESEESASDYSDSSDE